MSPAFDDLLRHWLPAYGYEPKPAVTAALTRFLQMLVTAQPRLRLVGSVEPDVLVRRHVGESLAVLQVRPLTAEALVDLGSGAGFPGLVLAIAVPALKTTLVESNQKKAAFLRDVVQTLGLQERVTIVSDYLERRPRTASPEPLQHARVWTVRALDKMDQVPAWLHRWLNPGAEVAFWLSSELAEQWRQRFTAWNWGPFILLPGADRRGILLARPVSRETSPPPTHSA